MTDPRVERLAELLVEYSLGLRERQMLRIDGAVVAAPLVLALYRAALAAGAHPYTKVGLEGLAEILLEEGSEAQLEYVPALDWREIELIDALVTIWSEENTRSLSGVDHTRQSRLIAARRELSERRFERISSGEIHWCGTLFPTHAHAQDASMSLEEYERFVFGACHVEDEDGAVAHWRSVSRSLSARARELEAVQELRVVGPDTDLRVRVGGRRWLVADGKRNMHDGEVFTSPLETETEGEIRYAFPASFQGREVEDVRLRFEGGRVVGAEARRGGDYLRSLLELEGASTLGEVAFGLNYEIDRFTHNILFDEKIGGTMHFALGSSFAEAGGRNTSALHWDMICDLREGGEVYADGELVWQAGRFLREPAVEESEHG